MDFKTEVYVLDRDGAEHEIPVRISYDCDYQAARISGPPEDCYPESGELEFTSIDPIGELPAGITQADLEAAAGDSSMLMDEAWDHWKSRGVDDRE